MVGVSGFAGSVNIDEAGQGKAGTGEDRHGLADLDRRGLDWHGKAGYGSADLDWHGKARTG